MMDGPSFVFLFFLVFVTALGNQWIGYERGYTAGYNDGLFDADRAHMEVK